MKPHIKKLRNAFPVKRLVLLLFALIFGVLGVALLLPNYAALPVPSTGWYVSPSGTANGNGSKDNPWDLATAFKFPTSVKPGDTIWLRGGKYGSGASTVFTSSITGTAAAPIKVRQYPNERATVDGGIIANGAYTWFWGFEITNTSPYRRVTVDKRPPGINMFGKGTKAINMIIHDVGHPGIGFWNNVADGGEIYGSLMWGNGLYDMGDPRFPNGWTRGSPIYAQNTDGSRYVKDNITFRNFTSGMKAYTQGGSANGFTFDGNIVFDATERGLFVAADSNPINFVKIIDNYLYERPQKSGGGIKLGYFGSLQGSATVTGNYAVGRNYAGGESTPLEIKNWQSATVNGNTLATEKFFLRLESTYSSSQYAVNNNSFFGTYATPFWKDTTLYNLTQWRGLGFDSASTVTTSLPAQNKVFTRKNAYEENRGNIAIYNWEKLPSVGVNLSGILAVGVPYEIRDAQNFYGTPLASGTYKGDSVDIPMNLSQVAPLTGDVTTIDNKHTAPEFAAFVVVPTGAVITGETVVPPAPPPPPGPPPATDVSPEIEEASIQTQTRAALAVAQKAAAVPRPTAPSPTASVVSEPPVSSPETEPAVDPAVAAIAPQSAVAKKQMPTKPITLVAGTIAVIAGSGFLVMTLRRTARAVAKAKGALRKPTLTDTTVINPTGSPVPPKDKP